MNQIALTFAALTRRVVLLLVLMASANATTPPLSAIQADLDAGRLVQADRAIAQVLAAQPDSAPAHYLSARVLAAEGKWPLARAALLRAEHLDPSMAFVPPHDLMTFAQTVERHSEAGPLQSSSRGVLVLAAAFLLIFLDLMVSIVRARARERQGRDNGSAS